MGDFYGNFISTMNISLKQERRKGQRLQQLYFTKVKLIFRSLHSKNIEIQASFFVLPVSTFLHSRAFGRVEWWVCLVLKQNLFAESQTFTRPKVNIVNTKKDEKSSEGSKS